MSEQTILVVDDEEAIAEPLRARLERRGIGWSLPSDGPQAIEAHAVEHPAPWSSTSCSRGWTPRGMPQIQREQWTPVLMLTARTEEPTRSRGSPFGADDYLTKPFSLRELAVRVRAILRRMEHIRSQKATGPIEHNGLTIDVQRRRPSGLRRGRLTPLEFGS